MALNIILGASGSGKTTRCFEEIDKKIKSESNSKMFMLVPEQFTFEGEKKLIEVLGEEVLLRGTVTNFKRLAHKVFSKVGGAKEKSLDDCGKAMLIYYILNSDRLKFATFGTVAHQKGFAALIGDMIHSAEHHATVVLIGCGLLSADDDDCANDEECKKGQLP